MKAQIKILAAVALLGSSFALAEEAAYRIVPAKSTVQWTGSKVVGGSHTGKISIKDGEVVFENGKAKTGAINIDMNSIVNEDLADKKKNQDLVGHLKSPDFFDVANNPTAGLVIDKIEAAAKGASKVFGTLTIKGKKKPVEFVARTADLKEGKVVKTDLTFDRAAFDVRYGSKTHFKDLVLDKVISDDIQLAIELFLEPKPLKTAKKQKR